MVAERDGSEEGKERRSGSMAELGGETKEESSASESESMTEGLGSESGDTTEFG